MMALSPSMVAVSFRELVVITASDSCLGRSVTSIQIEIDRELLAQKTCGTEHEEKRPNLSASWPRGRSILKLVYHMASVETFKG